MMSFLAPLCWLSYNASNSFKHTVCSCGMKAAAWCILRSHHAATVLGDIVVGGPSLHWQCHRLAIIAHDELIAHDEPGTLPARPDALAQHCRLLIACNRFYI
jgi:hypothetical protein